MATKPTISDLFQTKPILDQEVDAGVDAMLADLAIESYPFVKGWTFALVDTLRTSERAAEALKTDKPVWMRNMIWTGILLEHPVKG